MFIGGSGREVYCYLTLLFLLMESHKGLVQIHKAFYLKLETCLETVIKIGFFSNILDFVLNPQRNSFKTTDLSNAFKKQSLLTVRQSGAPHELWQILFFFNPGCHLKTLLWIFHGVMV